MTLGSFIRATTVFSMAMVTTACSTISVQDSTAITENEIQICRNTIEKIEQDNPRFVAGTNLFSGDITMDVNTVEDHILTCSVKGISYQDYVMAIHLETDDTYYERVQGRSIEYAYEYVHNVVKKRDEDRLLASKKAQEKIDAEQRARDAEAACLASKECLTKREEEERLAEQKKEQNRQQQQAYNKTCEGFFEDLATKTNFTHQRIVMARPMMTGAYICVAQGHLATPHGNQFKQVELQGNPNTGAYSYK